MHTNNFSEIKIELDALEKKHNEILIYVIKSSGEKNGYAKAYLAFLNEIKRAKNVIINHFALIEKKKIVKEYNVELIQIFIDWSMVIMDDVKKEKAIDIDLVRALCEAIRLKIISDKIVLIKS